ncbi:hypothetical protein KVF89_22320 [Nocardioides carbamazepini]|uniref:hypothetical protein n=1 Tax=Nocardioides carbamazepini TaxID=2854259 RepID=UPI00214A7EBE|nr:hypothetical protein [Nocardioides carbamazepini]MCR1785292.1 hypothetical protein [Nocardioides carbamazepini]
MTVIPYAQWSSRPRGATRASHPIGATKGVTLHWEGPHMGVFPHGRCVDKVRSIQAFHRDTRGWADIAYNAIVCPHGVIYEGRGPGVKSAANGNTAANDDWYAVCYLGGERDGVSDAGKGGMIAAVGWLRRAGGAGQLVNGHRDHKATSCPGEDIYDWLTSHDWNPEPARKKQRPKRIRKMIAKGRAQLAEAGPAQAERIKAALRELRKINKR